MRGVTKGALALGVALAALSVPASANHSWGGYHWARTQTELTTPIGDNVSSVWDSYLRTTNTEWNQSTVINSPLVPGSTSVRRCSPVAGTIQVCNTTYGRTGWLGIASIWLSSDGHIAQGTTKLNDTYFNTATYNTVAWRNLVSCQEVAHNYGLDHQDETFNNVNVGSCMDYTNAPSGGIVGGFNYGPSNERPNAHDYEELEIIYSHADSAMRTMFGVQSNAGALEVGDTPDTWGRAIRYNKRGQPDTYEKADARGGKVITHVFWAPTENVRFR